MVRARPLGENADGLHDRFVVTTLSPALFDIGGTRQPLSRLPPLPGPFGRLGTPWRPGRPGVLAEQHPRAALEFLRRSVTLPGPPARDRRASVMTDAPVGRRSTARPTGRGRCA
jgi:hypothetical protein